MFRTLEGQNTAKNIFESWNGNFVVYNQAFVKKEENNDP